MSKYGYFAVIQLEEQGYDPSTLQRIYNSALVHGKKREEITESYLVSEYLKEEEKRKNAESAVEVNKKVLTPSEFAEAQIMGILYHPVYGPLSYVGACAVGSTEVMAVTEKGKIVEVDIRDLYVPKEIQLYHEALKNLNEEVLEENRNNMAPPTDGFSGLKKWFRVFLSHFVSYNDENLTLDIYF